MVSKAESFRLYGASVARFSSTVEGGASGFQVGHGWNDLSHETVFMFCNVSKDATPMQRLFWCDSDMGRDTERQLRRDGHGDEEEGVPRIPSLGMECDWECVRLREFAGWSMSRHLFFAPKKKPQGTGFPRDHRITRERSVLPRGECIFRLYRVSVVVKLNAQEVRRLPLPPSYTNSS